MYYEDLQGRKHKTGNGGTCLINEVKAGKNKKTVI